MHVRIAYTIYYYVVQRTICYIAQLLGCMGLVYTDYVWLSAIKWPHPIGYITHNYVIILSAIAKYSDFY